MQNTLVDAEYSWNNNCIRLTDTYKKQEDDFIPFALTGRLLNQDELLEVIQTQFPTCRIRYFTYLAHGRKR